VTIFRVVENESRGHERRKFNQYLGADSGSIEHPE
jgi:hypothetical protein